MSTLQKLDPTSPVVQRAFRLRKRFVQDDNLSEASASYPGTQALPADLPQREESYPWQMWQKSDFFAYGEGASVHRCQAQAEASSIIK